jgi:hypothetical protein
LKGGGLKMEMDKNHIVFSMRMAGYLMQKGCRLIKLKNDKNNPNKHVYFFPNKDWGITVIKN